MILKLTSCRYFYPDPDNPSKVHVEETHSCELGQTGISDFKSNPSQAAHWVARSECVQESVARIPADLRPWSRIELCSTAGDDHHTKPRLTNVICLSYYLSLFQCGHRNESDETE